MKRNERLLVYPYDIEFTPVLRHKDLLKGYEINALIAPNGWGMSGLDASCADCGNNIGIVISSDFDRALECCDTVLFNQSGTGLDFKKPVYPRMIKSVQLKKNIICTLKLEPDVHKEMEYECEKNGVYFKSFNDYVCSNIPKSPESEEIFQLDTPLIYVLGTTERTHKFEIQLTLREQLLQTGYKISQVGTRPYSEMLGFHSFPQFMFSCSIAESANVTLFNHFVKQIELNEKPDVIIVGIPGAIMPFNNKITNRFGILAYEASLGVKPDAAVLSVLDDDYKKEYFELMSKTVKYKFGFDIDCFNISNVQFDSNNSAFSRAMVYTTLDSAFADKRIENFSAFNFSLYNILNKNSSSNMVNYLIDRLACRDEVSYI
jgi:peptide maturation system protein (TIGR04066 family)